MRSLWLALFATLLLGSACLGGDKASPGREAAAPSPAATRAPVEAVAFTGSADVYLVPVDEISEDMMEGLQAYFRDTHAVNVGVLPALPVDRSMFDEERRQLVADRVLEVMEAARPAENAGDVLIAVTDHDMYMLDKPDWNFVFSLRDISTNTAVVSVARMDPVNFGERRDDDLLFLRAAKMVGKNIGVLHLGLAMSTAPRSVMYDRLYSLDALDRVSDDFELR